MLRDARQAKKLSQEDLAEAAGLDRSFVSLVERGIQTPNLVVLLKISKVLGVSASVLVADVERMLRKSDGSPESTGVHPPSGKAPKRQRS